jgi:hypothetical protein
MSNDPAPLASFSEPEAQRILARAAELEATIGNRFTTEDLQQIASKAGIDAQALDRAIRETNAVVAQPVRNELPALMKPGRIAVLAGTGAILGTLAIAADKIAFPGGSAIPVFLPSGLFAFYLALRHPVREGFSGLVRELGIAFGAFTAAIVAMEGMQDASPAVTWSLLAGTLACGILSLRGARPNMPAPDPMPSDSR